MYCPNCGQRIEIRQWIKEGYSPNHAEVKCKKCDTTIYVEDTKDEINLVEVTFY